MPSSASLRTFFNTSMSAWCPFQASMHTLSLFAQNSSCDRGCSSFVEEKTTACHSGRSEESPHLKAQSVRKNAGILRFAQNDRQRGCPLRMADIAYKRTVIPNLDGQRVIRCTP